MSAEDPPLVAGAIHGLRVWHASWQFDGSLALCGYGGFAWLGGGEATVAWCEARGRHPGGAPAAGCGCGLYGRHPHATDSADLAAFATDSYGELEVAGIVEAWGRVEVHAEGFRAQYARPAALCAIGAPPDSHYERLIAAVARDYGARLLRFDEPDELIDHCRERGLGLDPGVVGSLVAEAEPPTPADSDLGAGLPGRAPRPPTRLERARELAGQALFVALAVIWFGFWAAMAVAVAIGVIAAVTEEPALTGRDLRVVEERLVRLGPERRYIAVVENTSATDAALRVASRGSLLDADGGELVRIADAEEVELRPSLAPGETGIVVDLIDDARDVVPRDVARYDTELVAEREPMPDAAPPRPSFHRLELDRDRCRLSATVRSEGTVRRIRVGAVVRNRAGEIASAGWFPVESIRRGSSRRVLVADNRPCPGFVEEIEVFAAPTPRQLLGFRPGEGP